MARKLTSKANITGALEMIEKTEEALADLYDWLAAEFEQDQEAARIFRHLRNMENSHVNLIRFERRLVMQERKYFSDIDIDSSSLETSLELIAGLRGKGPPLGLEEVIHDLLEIDAHACDRCYRDSILQANPELSNLFRGIVGEDGKTRRILSSFALSRGMAPSD